MALNDRRGARRFAARQQRRVPGGVQRDRGGWDRREQRGGERAQARQQAVREQPDDRDAQRAAREGKQQGRRDPRQQRGGEHAHAPVLGAVGAEVKAEDQRQHREYALGVPVGERVVQTAVVEAARGRPGVREQARDEPDQTDRGHPRDQRSDQPAQALGRVAHRAEQREGEHVEQRAVIRVQPERGCVRPQRRGELPGAEQDECRQRHGERAAEAFERARGERRAQDQSQREDDRREAGGAREEATRVERQVHDQRRRQCEQGDPAGPLQRLAPFPLDRDLPGRAGTNACGCSS